ncbi:MAG: 2,3-diphosphoglycerate-dependent phosphoglycerate mutase [Spirochaetaceae bacterium]|nr:2,3-diphosphoglycerate-dependent phosphoglycerate mutase [Spirochaetaceae bacterium]
MELVIVRHGESEWNKKNLFTGWSDVDLTTFGREQATNAGIDLKNEGFSFDVAYTSYLKRAIHTLDNIMDSMDNVYLPVIKAWQLNEKSYGALQGLNKAETAKKYGEDKVLLWRRSYDVKPPLLELDDERSPLEDPAYKTIDKKFLPLGESLKDTIERVIPYFENNIKMRVENGEKVIIVAHGNSLRALAKYFDKLSNEEILKVNIPTGIPLVYDFDKNWNVVEKHYIGDPDKIKKLIESVANQGKSK